MGGYGSGPRHGLRRSTVDQCLALDLAELARRGIWGQALATGRFTWLHLSRREVALLGFELEEPSPDQMLFRLTMALGQGLSRRELELPLKLQNTRPNFGGHRWWFTCPACQRRVRILYFPAWQPWPACRRCHGLVYETQQMHPIRRLIVKEQKLKSRLDSGLSDFEYVLERPKGVHRSTFERLLEKISSVETRTDAVLRERGVQV